MPPSARCSPTWGSRFSCSPLRSSSWAEWEICAGTFISAFALGMVMALTARYWSQGAETMVFIVMAIVLIFRPIDI